MPSGSSARQEEALALWADVLGEEGVVGEDECSRLYGPNISEFSPPRLLAALKPRTTEDVKRIIGIANRFAVPLYPISTGS
jgi:hypothetical protein